MGAIRTAANTAFRDFATDGVPASGVQKPDKAEVREVFSIIDGALSTAVAGSALASVAYATKAELDSDLAHDAGALGAVYNDGTADNNGIYVKAGGSGSGSWSLTDIALPGSFADDLSAVETALGDKQPLDGFLTTLSGLDDYDDIKAAASLVPGVNIQAYDLDLARIAALNSAADKFPYATGPQTWALATVTSAARGLLGQSSYSAMLTAMGGASASSLAALEASLPGLIEAAVAEYVDSNAAALAALTELAAALSDSPTGDVLTALGNRVRFDIDNQGLDATERQNARDNIDTYARAEVDHLAGLAGLNNGLAGDGTTDDAPALQALLDTGVKAIVLSGVLESKVYQFGARVDFENDHVWVRGLGDVTVRWEPGAVNTGSMFFVTGNHVTFENITFEGDQWEAFGDTIYPGDLVRYGDATVEIAGVRLINCRFVGGRKGLAIRYASDVTLLHTRFERQYELAGFTSHGCRNLTIIDYRAKDCAIGEGFKFGYQTTGQISSDVFIDAMFLENCGRADPDTAQHQEGPDMYLADIKRGWINFTAVGCGNGGAELKTEASSYPGFTDEFEELVFSDCKVVINLGEEQDSTAQPAFALNWNPGNPGTADSPTPDADKGRRIKFVNPTALYDPVAPSGGSMFQIMAYSEVEIINPTCNGAYAFIRTDGSGGDDATVKNLSVFGGKVRVEGFGIHHANGALNGLDLCGVDIEAKLDGMVFAIGTNPGRVTNVRIRGGSRIVSTGTAGGDNAIQGQCVDSLLVEDSYLEADNIVARFPASTGQTASAGGTIRRSTLKARDGGATCYGLDAAEGTWRYYRNDLELPDANGAGWNYSGAGTVLAAQNSRGVRTDTTPACGGAKGDVWFLAAPGLGNYTEIACVGNSLTAATWAVLSPIRLTGSKAFNPANLNDGDGETTTVTVTGAALGDAARATFGLDLQGILLNAYVSAADTVTCRFQNETGGAINLGSSTLRAWVEKV